MTILKTSNYHKWLSNIGSSQMDDLYKFGSIVKEPNKKPCRHVWRAIIEFLNKVITPEHFSSVWHPPGEEKTIRAENTDSYLFV
jgi:hypothetical protein